MLTSGDRKRLKSAAQHLEPVVFLGKAGLTEDFVDSVAIALASRELIKVKFTAFKDQRHELATEIAARTASDLVTIVGHVAVLYRPKPTSPPPP